MLALIPYPEISPEIFSFQIGSFTLALRWYALAYIVGLLIGWRLVVMAVKNAALWPKGRTPMTPPQVEELLTWIIFGVILGGRLGYVLFYKPEYYLANPSEIPMVWQGGMAFHGGLLGVIVAGLLFCRKHAIPMLSAADALALAAPPGLLLGRIANFINAELWGRPTDAPWAMIFPTDPHGLPRHPSQLYEAALEGLVLGLILIFLMWGRKAAHRPGQIAGAFFAGYGIARFIVEWARESDAQFYVDNPYGYAIWWGDYGLSMGQLLSLPMVAIGLGLILIARHRTKGTA
ncbi:prolipoprotein diacylglyceryl transferase [Donghicola tyrosinivorans]|uniref:Phosphatidylglycerol--prolipoprotein diacylglyceryl transferase n=1 Tax=Donghicola tyrosinivorans TaxID=1652492 RepID=A0A2T0X0H3_9RHOB|nr:prolipoprotein diacylglyceryl transferase [Donghicola tyrosinivorans]PRY92449.1 phosphatidylglycerol:prolipoprotein diacylglycerol transferase [Donghicola tyrosinivorans]